MFLGETKSFPLTGRLFLPRRRGRRGRPLDVLPADELQVVQQRPLEAEAGGAGLVGAGERLQGAVAGVAVGVATANTFPHDYLILKKHTLEFGQTGTLYHFAGQNGLTVWQKPR